MTVCNSDEPKQPVLLVPLEGESLFGRRSQKSESSDTGTSTARGVVVEVLSVGDIEGLNEGDKGIYLDRTPIRSKAGFVIYPNVNYAFRRGTQNQKILPEYAQETLNETTVGTQVKKSLGMTTRTIVNPELDAIRVRIQLALYDVRDDIRQAYSFHFRIWTKEGTDPWRERVDRDFTALFKSPVEQQYTMPVNNLNGTRDTFGVRIQVLSDDEDNPNDEFRQLVWTSYTEVIRDKFNHSNLAVICHQFNTDLFSSIPERAYDLNGKIVSIPSNAIVKDDGSLTFTSPIWNGTLIKPNRACSDPVWQLIWILTSPEGGLSDYIQLDQLNLASFYQCSVYNNEPVPNGRGGVEPRFMCKTVLRGKQKAREVIDAFCSAFHAKIFETHQIDIWQDRPKNEVEHQFTNADVENGDFVYSFTGIESRHNFVIVSYNDSENFFTIVPEPVENPAAIASQGLRSTESAKFGCCRRSEAIREGRWILWSAQEETLIVTFTARAIAQTCLPGELMRIGDYRLSGIRYDGLVVFATGTTVILDAPVTLVGTGLVIFVTLPSGQIESRNVLNGAGNHTSINVSPAFSAAPQPESSWIIASDLVQPPVFRILNVSPSVEPGKYEITGIIYKAEKWAYVENNIEIPDPPIRITEIPPVNTPNSVAISPSQGSALVTFGWAATSTGIDPNVIRYLTEISTDRFTWQNTRSVSLGTYEMFYEALPTGSYYARVASVDISGSTSDWAYSPAGSPAIVS